MMLAGQTILLFLILLLLTKLTKQAKKEECVKGKTYWSEESFIPSQNGLCIACPPDWKTCNHQPIGNGNRQRCVDSCQAKQNLPLTPTTSFISLKVIPSTPTSVAYTLHVPPPVDVNEQEKESSDGNEDFEKNTWLVIAVSALAVFIVISIVALLLVIRKIRSTSARARNRDRINEEEGIILEEIPARNDEEDRLNEENDGGEQEEERHYDEVLRASDTENRLVAAQETQTPGLPVQATRSERNICRIQDTEVGNFPSCFHLNQVET